MKLTTETFFEILFDVKPKFFLDLSYADEPGNTKPALYFSSYDSPKRFYNEFSIKADKIIFELKNKRSLNEINDQFLMNYIEKLSESIHSFHNIKYESVSYHCHKDYSIDHYLVTPPDSIKLEDLEKEFQIQFFEYSKYKFSVTNDVIQKLKGIIKEHSEENNFITTKQQIFKKDEAIMGLCFNKKIPENKHYKIFKLWNEKIIETDFINFKMAFTGQLLSTSLNIKWLLKHRNDTSKTALIFLLSSEIFEDILVDKDFRKIVQLTFVDLNGNAIKEKSFATLLNDYKKRYNTIYESNQPWKRIVDDIIKRTNLLTRLP